VGKIPSGFLRLAAFQLELLTDVLPEKNNVAWAVK
jgi:hypothetical protein